jgi:hypothetical protein
MAIAKGQVKRGEEKRGDYFNLLLGAPFHTGPR